MLFFHWCGRRDRVATLDIVPKILAHNNLPVKEIIKIQQLLFINWLATSILLDLN